MKKKETILHKDLHLIKVSGEENNSKTREAWKGKYKRIYRENRSKFWVWFYYWTDRINKKRRIRLRKKIAKIKERGRSMEEELKVMKKNKGYISNGKVKNE